ncbi:hypothetical protein [Bradyrhizobium sp. CCBAU 53338]|uniref:hypothetical protein n=1 Tax=Bradyrhizobium sp. CCBAU 53338 TaxID=1325111 RepID=UPI00188C0C66|nr:hypothetical protein [Bradyrhizobium sp. CCBAU 53338]QOZ50517.1 hypothetical protein XH90_03450 [Bradyrhizobium sp. CCBAU 53338]
MLDRRVFLATAGATLIAAPTASLGQTTPNKRLRIVVVANRYHEADGLTVALCNQMAHSTSLSFPHDVVWPRTFPPDPNLSSKPRCLIDVKKQPSDTDPSASMEIWCIDDIANVKGDSGAKVAAMKTITDFGPAPDGVIAFGTGGYPGDVSYDGCATIGGTIFMHDASNGAPGSWSWPGYMDTLVPSKIAGSFFSSVAADQKMLDAISLEMIKPKNNPAKVLELLIAPDAVAVCSVNEPPPYCDADKNSIAIAQQKGATNITSVETTHGVIRSMWDAPFMYVTAIPNRVCKFDEEARGIYAQEFPSSHNAGIALKYVIPSFVSAIAQ